MSQPDGAQRPDLPEPFEVEVRPDHARVFVIPRGELDMASTDKVADSIDALVGNGVAEIVLDLRELTFMDSAGVRLVVQQTRSPDRRVSIIDGNEPVARLFDLTGLRPHLPFFTP
jgi:anti-sigma B factor antagonist